MTTQRDFFQYSSRIKFRERLFFLGEFVYELKWIPLGTIDSINTINYKKYLIKKIIQFSVQNSKFCKLVSIQFFRMLLPPIHFYAVIFRIPYNLLIIYDFRRTINSPSVKHNQKFQSWYQLYFFMWLNRKMYTPKDFSIIFMILWENSADLSEKAHKYRTS